jgi:hypothetical protein
MNTKTVEDYDAKNIRIAYRAQRCARWKWTAVIRSVVVDDMKLPDFEDSATLDELRTLVEQAAAPAAASLHQDEVEGSWVVQLWTKESNRLFWGTSPADALVTALEALSA